MLVITECSLTTESVIAEFHCILELSKILVNLIQNIKTKTKVFSILSTCLFSPSEIDFQIVTNCLSFVRFKQQQQFFSIFMKSDFYKIELSRFFNDHCNMVVSSCGIISKNRQFINEINSCWVYTKYFNKNCGTFVHM